MDISVLRRQCRQELIFHGFGTAPGALGQRLATGRAPALGLSLACCSFGEGPAQAAPGKSVRRRFQRRPAINASRQLGSGAATKFLQFRPRKGPFIGIRVANGDTTPTPGG